MASRYFLSFMEKCKYYIKANNNQSPLLHFATFSYVVKHRFGVYCQYYFEGSGYKLGSPQQFDVWVKNGYLVEVSEEELALIVA